MDVAEATRAVEIQVSGMEGRTALEEHLRRTLELHRHASEQARRADLLIYEAANHHQHPEQLGESEDVEEMCLEKLEEAAKALKQIQLIEKKIDKRMTSFETAFDQLRHDSPESLHGATNLSSLYNDVCQKNDALLEKIDLVRTHLTDTRAAVLK